MLACDVIFAARDARAGDQHVQFGLVPGWGGSQRFARIVGLRRPGWICFYRALDGAPRRLVALQWGVVNYVVRPEKLAEAARSNTTQDHHPRARRRIATP